MNIVNMVKGLLGGVFHLKTGRAKDEESSLLSNTEDAFYAMQDDEAEKDSQDWSSEQSAPLVFPDPDSFSREQVAPEPARAQEPLHTETGKKTLNERFSELSTPKQLAILGVPTMLIVLGIFSFLFSSPSAPAQPQKQQKKMELAANVPAEQGTGETRQIPVAGGTVMENPFVELNDLKEQKDGKAAQNTQQAQRRMGNLPAIPSNPRPNIPPGLKLPKLPGAPGNQVAAAPQQAYVQGVVTGSEGNNMAVMSDGSVVSAGETFKDGRIAYIGGDGIHFENGSTMKIKTGF